MTQWFVKNLSKLTGVSVQTLHHYDRIGLLKPSLQQIIALKFFGFELSLVKTILAEESNALNHFNSQIRILEEKAAVFQEGANTLKSIISSVVSHKSIPWETIIQLIEVYKMAEQLEHKWVKEIFTPDELKQYAEFEKEMKHNKTPEQKAAFEKERQQLMAEVKQSAQQDPNSAAGIQTGKKYMEWINGLYGKKYAHLRTKKWEKGFGEGKGLEDIGFTPELMTWLEKALDAYWTDRLSAILAEVGKSPEAVVANLWNQALDDMYGNETARKKAVYDMAIQDDRTSPAAKAWLRSRAK
jgi:DNA-binding transcriptional MerR regulator